MKFKIYIDKQTHNRFKLKPYRLRIMQGTNECTAMHFETEKDANRAKLFAKKVLASTFQLYKESKNG